MNELSIPLRIYFCKADRVAGTVHGFIVSVYSIDKTCDDYGISIEKSNNIADRFDRIITKLCFEFKVDEPVENASPLEVAWQIEDKDYASIYADSGKQIMKVGVVFSRKQRNIIEYGLTSSCTGNMRPMK